MFFCSYGSFFLQPFCTYRLIDIISKTFSVKSINKNKNKKLEFILILRAYTTSLAFSINLLNLFADWWNCKIWLTIFFTKILLLRILPCRHYHHVILHCTPLCGLIKVYTEYICMLEVKQTYIIQPNTRFKSC